MFFFRLLVLILVFGSAWWCARILRRNTVMTDPVSVILLTCSILAIEFCIGPYNFGQREHLLIILLVPYILAAATGVVYRLSFAERCVLGMAAGFAIWFKPHDALILVGLETFLAFRARSLRRALTPEFLALVVTSSLVLLVMSVITPLYSKVTVPLLFDTYWALGTVDALSLALGSHFYVLEIFLVSLACLLFRRSLRDSGASVVLLVCGISGFFAFVIQHNDWWYHAYPHQALLLLAMAYLATDLLYPVTNKLLSDLHLRRRLLIVASGIAAIFLCAIAIRPRILLTVGTHSQKYDLDEFLAQYKPSTTVYVFSTTVAPLSFAYNHGLNWGSRFAHLWMLPAIIQNERGPTERGPAVPPAPFKRLSPEKVARIGMLQRTETAEDLNYWKPSVVFVEQFDGVNHFCPGIEGKEFDMLSWFLESPEFATAWSHYQRKQPDFENFAIYERIP